MTELRKEDYYEIFIFQIINDFWRKQCLTTLKTWVMMRINKLHLKKENMFLIVISQYYFFYIK